MRFHIKLAALVFLFGSGANSAPPPGSNPNAEASKWFRSLQIPGSETLCCDETDCRAVDAKFENGEWFAWLSRETHGPSAPEEPRWVHIPSSRIVHDKGANPAGGKAVLCWLPMPGYEEILDPQIGVLCFTLPAAGG